MSMETSAGLCAGTWGSEERPANRKVKKITHDVCYEGMTGYITAKKKLGRSLFNPQ